MEIDVEIINRVKKGNKEAYGIIVKKYMKKAYFMALGLVGDSNDALDLSQTAFIKAYRSLSGFDQKRPFLPWFYAILRNLCLNFIKRKKSISIIPLQEGAQSDILPGRKDYQEDMKEIVSKAISSLSYQERAYSSEVFPGILLQRDGANSGLSCRDYNVEIILYSKEIKRKSGEVF